MGGYFQRFWSSRSGVGLENLHFNKFPSDAEAVGPGTLWRPLQQESDSTLKETKKLPVFSFGDSRSMCGPRWMGRGTGWAQGVDELILEMLVNALLHICMYTCVYSHYVPTNISCFWTSALATDLPLLLQNNVHTAKNLLFLGTLPRLILLDSIHTFHFCNSLSLYGFVSFTDFAHSYYVSIRSGMSNKKPKLVV